MNPLYETWVDLHDSLTYKRTGSFGDSVDQFLPGEASKPRVSDGPEPRWRYHFDEEMQVRHCRQELVRRFSWSVPSPCAVRRLVDLGPIIEVGAGLGYWARCVADAGGEIIAMSAVDVLLDRLDAPLALRDGDEIIAGLRVCPSCAARLGDVEDLAADEPDEHPCLAVWAVGEKAEGWRLVSDLVGSGAYERLVLYPPGTNA